MLWSNPRSKMIKHILNTGLLFRSNLANRPIHSNRHIFTLWTPDWSIIQIPTVQLTKNTLPMPKIVWWAKEVAYQGLIVFVSRMVWTGPKARLVLSSICKWIKRSIKFQLFFHFYKSKLKFRREFRKKLNADNWDLKRSPNLPWHLYYYCKPADVVEIRTWTRLPLLKKQ